MLSITDSRRRLGQQRRPCKLLSVACRRPVRRGLDTISVMVLSRCSRIRPVVSQQQEDLEHIHKPHGLATVDINITSPTYDRFEPGETPRPGRPPQQASENMTATAQDQSWATNEPRKHEKITVQLFFLLLSRLVSYTNHKITTRSTTTNTTTTPNSKGRRKSAVTPSFVKLIVKLVNYYHGNRKNNTPASWPCRHTLLQPTDGHGCITSGN